MKEKVLSEKIIDLLRETGVAYNLVEHPAVFNSVKAAKMVGASLSQGTKALILLGDGKPLMVVVSGEDKVDFQKIKKLIKVKNLALAIPEEVQKISGVEIGAVPPFGNLFNIPLYVDTKLGNEKEIFFSAGSHSVSIRMKYVDFQMVSNPIIGSFAK